MNIRLLQHINYTPIYIYKKIDYLYQVQFDLQSITGYINIFFKKKSIFFL